MHKYQPRVHVVKRKDNAAIHTLEGQDYRTFLFPETVFIGVTAYQNQLVSVSIGYYVIIYTIRLTADKYQQLYIN